MDKLPTEIIIKICYNLKPYELDDLSCTCRRVRTIVKNLPEQQILDIVYIKENLTTKLVKLISKTTRPFKFMYDVLINYPYSYEACMAYVSRWPIKLGELLKNDIYRELCYGSYSDVDAIPLWPYFALYYPATFIDNLETIEYTHAIDYQPEFDKYIKQATDWICENAPGIFFHFDKKQITSTNMFSKYLYSDRYKNYVNDFISKYFQITGETCFNRLGFISIDEYPKDDFWNWKEINSLFARKGIKCKIDAISHNICFYKHSKFGLKTKCAFIYRY